MLQRLKASLGIKLLILALIGAMIGLTISLGIAWAVAERQAENRAATQIESELVAFQSAFAREIDDLVFVGNWLVSQEPFVAMLESRDYDSLTALLEPLTQASIVDSLSVADRSGVVVTRVRSDESPSRGDSILIQAGVTEALAGESTSGMERDRLGRLQGRVILPVYGKHESLPIGVLVLGHDIEGGFIHDLPLREEVETMVVYKDVIALFALSDPTGITFVGRVAPGEVLQAEREHRESGIVMLETSKGRYRFKFKPIWGPSRAIIGMLGLGEREANFEIERSSLLNVLGIALLASIADALFITFLATRVLLAPLRQLHRAAATISQGDTSLRLELPRSKDEFGLLAMELESMRRQMGDRLQAAILAKNQMEAVINSMNAALLITDQTHQVGIVNPAARVLLHESTESIVGQPWQKLFVETPHASSAESSWKLAGDKPLAVPAHLVSGRFHLKSNPSIVLQINSTPIQVDDVAFGYVHLLHDVSAQERLIRAKDEFVLNVAHELRSPLSSLRATIDLLSEEYVSMNRRDLKLMIHAMQRALGRFQNLVENLIDMGSIQAGQFTIRTVNTDLRRMLNETIHMVKPILDGREQPLEVNIDLPEDYLVCIDQPRLIQVMFNLLNNASKYGPEGQPILLSVFRQGGFVVVQVTDKGPGIPPEDQVHLFERFYRSKRIDQEGSGIGLGLALARGIIQAHGGKIGLESRAGKGTTFWFSIPDRALAKADQAYDPPMMEDMLERGANEDTVSG